MNNDAKALEMALEYAEKMHAGQKRTGGEPYISHPIAVAEIMRKKGYGTDYQITALFHDLLEDTAASRDDILRLGDPAVLKAVELLTKQKGYIMEEYVANIRKDPMAFAVKGADRLHNLKCAVCTTDEFKRRYILETVDWYLDFAPEIPSAVKSVAESLSKPFIEMSFLYEPIETWKVCK